jgi:hypothetical protein
MTMEELKDLRRDLARRHAALCAVPETVRSRDYYYARDLTVRARQRVERLLAQGREASGIRAAEPAVFA